VSNYTAGTADALSPVAAEELKRTVAEIEANAEYDEVEFSITMQHLYRHGNTA